MKNSKSHLIDALFLGICSIATQTVYIKLIFSSQVGGELYAALAIGGWIAAVGTGSFIGMKFTKDRQPAIWLFSAIIKIPLAVFIFVYPSFFTGILDPLRFLPLVIIGMFPSGILYGMMFPLLITAESKTTVVYRNEAIGSVVGGLLSVMFSLAGFGGFAVLFLLAGLEISRSINRDKIALLIIAGGFVAGIFSGPFLDKTCLDIRWPGFKTIKTSHGFSGLWAVHSREGQLTLTHNGKHLSTLPDRQSSEEALLWPLLFRPDATSILLIGFEGVESKKYLPLSISATKLISDKSFFRLGVYDSTDFATGDPLSFSPPVKYDIVNIMLHGGGNLSDYRIETGYFFKKCRNMLKADGILYISSDADENYIAPDLGGYLSSLRKSLKSNFDSVIVIPGARAGFVCLKKKETEIPNPITALSELNLQSPYFNESLILNRLSAYRLENYQIPEAENSNYLFKPKSIIHYLRWQGSMFGGTGRLFQIYSYPFLLFFIPLLILIPIVFWSIKKIDIAPISAVTLFGFFGLAAEIFVLYIFQILFGSLYLHIGMILAVFMAGLALGAHYCDLAKPYYFPLPAIFLLALLPALPLIIELKFGLKIVLILLYMISLMSGVCSGSGFAYLAKHKSRGRSGGATLYGADLYGALIAAVFIPGVLMVSGANFLAGVLVAIGLIISATLWYCSQ